MRAGLRNNGGRPVDFGALLHGWIGAGIVLVLWAALLTTIGMFFAQWEPSRTLLRSLALLSAAVGGFVAGRKCQCRAWLNGTLTAVGLFVTWAWLTGGLAPETAWLVKLRAFCLVSFLGMLGGIIGGLNR